jgi:hypothetical protein
MTSACAATLQDRSNGAVRRVFRAVAFLLVLALHGALLLLASRWQTHLDIRSEESLIFLQLPSHAPEQEPAQAPAPPPEMPRKKPAPTREMQVIILPKEVPPSPPYEAPPAPIDWNAEAALTAKQLAQSEAKPRPRVLDQADGWYFEGRSGSDPGAGPEFGWYHARVHRIEALEGGGSMLWLNDRCFIVMAGLIPFPMCGVGKIPPRADLFDHMRDARTPDQPGTPP